MSTITNIASSDVLEPTSRSNINTNFSNLNTDKQEKASGATTGNLAYFGSSNTLQDSGITGTSTITASSSTTLTNKTISGASNTLSNISLTAGSAEVTGTLPIANGGTNASGALNNGRVIISSAGGLIESTTSTGSLLMITSSVGFNGLGLGTANQLLGMSSTGSDYEYKTLQGTTNQVTVTNGTKSLTLALPQSIATSSTPQFAGLGVGTTALANVSMVATGQYFSSMFVATTGSINWNNANIQYYVLSVGTNGISLANPRTGARYLLILEQPSTNPATINWSENTIKWQANSIPTLTIGSSKADLVTFIYSGPKTTYYGNNSLNY